MQTLEKTLNIRVPEATHSRLAQLTKSTGRTKSFLAIEARTPTLTNRRGK